MPQVTLLIPAYNEAAIIGGTVLELDRFMHASMPDWTYEILIVDDGSTDGMAEVLAGMGGGTVRVERHTHNRGRGAAIRTGFLAARGQYVICLDADLSYAPDHIPRLLLPLAKGEADITLASAYHPEGKVKNVPFVRAALSRYGNRLLSTGVYGQFRTLTCVVRGFRKDVLDRLELVSEGKDLHIEILHKATLFGFRIIEVPATLEWRSKDRAKRVGKRWRFPLFSMSETIASHLVYNYVLRPGSLLVVPLVLLVLTVAGGSLLLFVTWMMRTFSYGDGSFLGNLYRGLRETLLHGSLTVGVVAIAAIITLIFLAFYFNSQQNKRQFDELYVLMSRMNERLKRLEAEVKN